MISKTEAERMCRPLPEDTAAYRRVLGSEVRVINGTTGGEKNSKDERFDLLPFDQLAKVARLYGFGANKYAAHNWRKGYAWSLSIAALQRHMAAFMHGEEFDEETGCEHLTSVVFHALALLWFMDKHNDLDDRFTTEGGAQ